MNRQNRQDRARRRAKAMRLKRWQGVPFINAQEHARYRAERGTGVLAWLAQHIAGAL